MVAKRRRRCPQEHGWASQRAAAGRGGPGGADAGCAFVTVSASSASVRLPVSGASVQCPRVPVHATGVQCPVRTSERPGVRCGRLSVQVSGVQCPVSSVASGVHAFRVRCVRPGGRGGRRGGRQPRGWDGRGRRGRPPCPRPARRLPESAPGDRGWRRPCWASGGVGLDLAVVVGGGWAVARSTACRPGGVGCARESPVVGELGWAARWRPRSVVIVEAPGPGRLVATSLPARTATCARGRSAAATCSERRRLDAGDALTCEVGVEVRGFEPLASSVRETIRVIA